MLLQIGKITGEEWKSMTKAHKASYEEVARKQKEEYLKQMEVYNQKKLEVCKIVVLYFCGSHVLVPFRRYLMGSLCIVPGKRELGEIRRGAQEDPQAGGPAASQEEAEGKQHNQGIPQSST
jgi:hypothetical protein